jgi:hypothetical protein
MAAQRENPLFVPRDANDIRKAVLQTWQLSMMQDITLSFPLVFIILIVLFMNHAMDNSLLQRSFPQTNAALLDWVMPCSRNPPKTFQLYGLVYPSLLDKRFARRLASQRL